MYYVSKRMEVAGSHHLDLPYESKCSNLHGHNWIITVHCKSEKLTDYGMIVDFALVKKEIHKSFGKEFAPRNRLSRYRYWLSVKCVSSSKRMVSYSAP